MTREELFDDWEARAIAAGRDLAAVRKLAGVHPANFSNWRRAKCGMTLASIEKVEAAVVELENRAAIATCGICDRRSSDPACAACTAPDCGLRQKDAA